MHMLKAVHSTTFDPVLLAGLRGITPFPFPLPLPQNPAVVYKHQLHQLEFGDGTEGYSSNSSWPALIMHKSKNRRICERWKTRATSYVAYNRRHVHVLFHAVAA